MESMEGVGVYGEAKTEYTRQVCNFLVPALEHYFLDMLTETKEREKDPKKVLFQFQKQLEEIPDWNVDKVQRETALILGNIKCDYMEELLTAVFIAHTKVLSAIRLTSKQKKLQITIPKLDHFLFRCLQECARKLWSNAYLLSDQVSNIDRQKNLRQVEQLIHEGVLQSIHGMLPVKNILREYLSEDAENDGDEKEEKIEEKPVVTTATEAAPVPESATAPESEHVPESTPASVATSEQVLETAPAAVAVSESVPETAPADEPEAAPSPAPAAEPAPATIIVATEPSVSFTKMDTIFDHADPEKNQIALVEDEEDTPDFLKILDEPAGEMDDFEDLNKLDSQESILENEDYEQIP